MDLELKKLIGVEVSEEFLIENKIETIEQYRLLVNNDNNKGSKNKNKNKFNKNEKQISSTNEKQMKRKNETLLNKKIKNKQRSKILESLQNHNNQEERKIVNLLESSKNLGKKRKNSFEKKINSNEKDNQLDMEKSEEEIYSSYFSDSDLDVETRKNKFNLSLNEIRDISKNDTVIDLNKNINKLNIVNNYNNTNLMNISPEEREKILLDIKQFRKREAEQEHLSSLRNNTLDISEFDDGEFGVSELPIPEKIHVKIVQRNSQIQTERLNLPIVKYEQEIMDKINYNLCTVICGETGSGKSTQIPQFLYEYGYTSAFGAIAVTQPRRVAAISLATRVAIEMNSKLSEEVGYQIRYDSHHFSDKTVIKYLTDGILLKEIESDNFLLKYSVVIIDEAHERTINTDIIIGLLSKAARYRYLMSKKKIKISEKEVKPLRVIIMSATMRVDEFLESDVFNYKPAFIKVEARRFPVTVHHLKKTESDYLEQAYKMTCKIHRKLPPGGILVFLTGKLEILRLCERLKKEFEENQETINDILNKDDNNNKCNTNYSTNKITKNQEQENSIREMINGDKIKDHDKMKLKENEQFYDKDVNKGNSHKINTEIELNRIEKQENLDLNIDDKKNEENMDTDKDFEPRIEDLIMIDEEENITNNQNEDRNSDNENDEEDDLKIRFKYKPALVLPLFSSLTKDQQMNIFKKLDNNTRLIVVSTNIAETSLTIPNVRYVVDSGKAKKRVNLFIIFSN